MRLGIYGGTFDPVHYGHLILAEQCREQCALDEVWFIPAAVPPHKIGDQISSGETRCEMLELAIAGYPEFQVSRMELERDGPSYTVDTLSALQSEDPTRELFLLIGADSVADFPTWREPSRIADLARLVVVNRGDDAPDLSAVESALGADVVERIDEVVMPGVDLSATDLRGRVAEGRSIRYMTPRAVEVYVAEHGLYAAVAGES
ncbi:MAG: nicotinate-nucleotide adenylyltransferase [Planctomycetota bacterium]|nr:MAG: nicotinate-nucleotide adenylyltransferase [Planctomycetota bacterium]REJ95856.1 MAG: nicotinate-nucleotide adenylyltransferase [Planctomycetota bacterium]REK20691.1 MAG: nicotinate-nucleotide adenylyltransferase [Planctomycetota bacterium]REK38127.1 MAG: nicotinate-nucleotide adenylyltransferase [Planctomycetota bacterium]